MNNGTVKYALSQSRVSGSLQMTLQEKMSLYIFPRSWLMDLRLWKKDRK